ncbi:unnamed protein product [Toxocara canis]|uniref:Membrane progestin receptor alpha-B n=1 Tax=Toxocara canis TaxID=6265 RepID=A0A183U1B3_TOXCA|nr:unnamed protein product [Toxocara canis]
MLADSEVPQLLKRSHIRSGYRPLNQSWRYYIVSAFIIHNEFINIWTHLVSLIYLCYAYVHSELQTDRPRLPLLLLYFGIFSLFACSALAHLMHSRSPLDHIFWYLIDFAGIAVFSVSVGLQRYTCAQQLSTVVEVIFLPGLLLIALLLQFLSSSYLFVCRPYWPPRIHIRAASCLLLTCWLYWPLLQRYSGDFSLSLHTRAFIWLLISGFFISGQIPERFAPGLFDFFGYGHQLFHVCIIMVTWNLCEAAHLDCSYSDTITSNNRHLSSIVCLILTLAVIVSSIKNLMKSAKCICY